MVEPNKKNIINKKLWEIPEIFCLDIKETKGGLEDNVVEDYDTAPEGSQ